MNYYEKNGTLYTSNAPINNKDFLEITKDEYELRLDKIKVEYTPSDAEDEWFVKIDEATKQDYQDALVEMGVKFDD